MPKSRSRKEMPERAPLTGTDLYPSVNDNGRLTGETRDEQTTRWITESDVQIENMDHDWVSGERAKRQKEFFSGGREARQEARRKK